MCVRCMCKGWYVSDDGSNRTVQDKHPDEDCCRSSSTQERVLRFCHLRGMVQQGLDRQGIYPSQGVRVENIWLFLKIIFVPISMYVSLTTKILLMGESGIR